MKVKIMGWKADSTTPIPEQKGSIEWDGKTLIADPPIRFPFRMNGKTYTVPSDEWWKNFLAFRGSGSYEWFE